MPRNASDIVYGKNGEIISKVDYVIPDTKLEKAIAWLENNDPNAITNLAQARPFIIAHHRILLAICRAQYKGVFDEPEDGTI